MGAMQSAADKISTLLRSHTGNLSVTDLNYLGAYFLWTSNGAKNYSQNLFTSLVGIIGQISQAPMSQLQAAHDYCGTSNKFFTSLEALASHVDLGENGDGLSVNVPNLAVQTFQVPDTTQPVTAQSIVGFAASANTEEISTIADGDRAAGGTKDEVGVSVVLPDSLITWLRNESSKYVVVKTSSVEGTKVFEITVDFRTRLCGLGISRRQKPWT